jgi:hypothetical protein
VALFGEEFGGGLADAVRGAGDEDAGHGFVVLRCVLFGRLGRLGKVSSRKRSQFIR